MGSSVEGGGSVSNPPTDSWLDTDDDMIGLGVGRYRREEEGRKEGERKEERKEEMPLYEKSGSVAMDNTPPNKKFIGCV